MPCLTQVFDPRTGPVVTVGIAPPQASPTGMDWIRALVDTGSSHSAVSASAARRARLPSIAKTIVMNTSQITPADVYAGDLYLPYENSAGRHVHQIPRCRLVEILLPSPNFDMLIGRDILSIGTLIVIGQTNVVNFCW